MDVSKPSLQPNNYAVIRDFSGVTDSAADSVANIINATKYPTTACPTFAALSGLKIDIFPFKRIPVIFREKLLFYIP